MLGEFCEFFLESFTNIHTFRREHSYFHPVPRENSLFRSGL
ncbi:hypothetical protein L21SP2_2299 [Salinispira pacifica]|uniref:Uncharacterized protein n=1 Tax=Salinispira pacifica TaxID=1307761 RepID=V5WKD6_9SPIO|nr:hypothetical protein L21SP2_2299 [Salinispira pacifica]